MHKLFAARFPNEENWKMKFYDFEEEFPAFNKDETFGFPIFILSPLSSNHLALKFTLRERKSFSLHLLFFSLFIFFESVQ